MVIWSLLRNCVTKSKEGFPKASVKEFFSSLEKVPRNQFLLKLSRTPNKIRNAVSFQVFKMKTSVAVCAIFVMVLAFGGEATPADFPERSTFDFDVFKPAVPDHGVRHRRVTCDLLSFHTKWGSINHAACAAHCLAMLKGFKGGHCDGNGVCVCRK